MGCWLYHSKPQYLSLWFTSNLTKRERCTHPQKNLKQVLHQDVSTSITVITYHKSMTISNTVSQLMDWNQWPLKYQTASPSIRADPTAWCVMCLFHPVCCSLFLSFDGKLCWNWGVGAPSPPPSRCQTGYFSERKTGVSHVNRSIITAVRGKNLKYGSREHFHMLLWWWNVVVFY